jgi:hypothetical protein
MMEELIHGRLLCVRGVGPDILIAGSFTMKREGHGEMVLIIAETSVPRNSMY